ncbi:MAG: GMC family oxidoreductase [Rhodothermales bacterium]|nr:GMC family oxidoreductase [Rhodothermales bacterium]MDG2015977.1 GMC family oxidoreductase [Rhodothermales bacterium]
MNIKLNTEFDAIVVGSGMTGGMAAKELCERGLKTLVLDRGVAFEHGTSFVTEHKRPFELPRHGRVPKEELNDVYSTQGKVYLFDEATKHLFVKDNEQPYIQEKPYDWIRANQVGGRSLMWARQTYRWGPQDFTANQVDGHGVDWPIRYDDIAPWYDYVEGFVGISGRAEGLRHLPDGQFLPPMEMTAVEKNAKMAIEAAFENRRMTIGRCAVLTQELNGRAPCHYCGECERGCSTRSFFSAVSVSLPAAAATGNMTLRPNSIVESILYDAKTNRASGVRVIDSVTHEVTEYRSKLLFMCASCLGTTQIMLNSKSAEFPEGIANGSGALGHYLGDHHMGIDASGFTDAFDDRYYSGSRPNGIYIPRFRNLDAGSRRSDYVRGFAYQGSSWRAGVERGAVQEGIGIDFKNKLRDPGPWEMQLWGYGETLPNYDNHCRLSPTEVDQWGIPQLIVSAGWGDNELAMRKDCAECAQEMMEAAGFRDISVNDNLEDNPQGLAIHEMGTARMGRDPQTSVLNAFNQAHEVPNLFVTDGACMTSTAVQNPSITYMALTARAVDYAVKEMASGNI